MSTPSQRIDPRVLRTRQLIRDAFIDLLQEIELEKITVNRIAERATINRVTFYLHYRDIPDMLERMADDMINEIHAILKEDSESVPVLDSDWSVLVKMLEHIAENSNFYKVVLASKRIPVFTERLMKLIVDLITSTNREARRILIGFGCEHSERYRDLVRLLRLHRYNCLLASQ